MNTTTKNPIKPTRLYIKRRRVVKIPRHILSKRLSVCSVSIRCCHESLQRQCNHRPLIRYCSLMRGSSHPYKMSAKKLAKITENVIIIKIPCINV